jgi:hypothetical protein
MPKSRFYLKKTLKPAAQAFRIFNDTIKREAASDLSKQRKAYQDEVKDIGSSKRPLVLADTTSFGTKIKLMLKVQERSHKLSLWKWRFVTGTKPHIIRARNAFALRFQLGYSAKMRGGSGTYSGPIKFAKAVHHPGYRPVNTIKYLATKFSNKRKASLKKWGAKGLNNAK